MGKGTFNYRVVGLPILLLAFGWNLSRAESLNEGTAFQAPASGTEESMTATATRALHQVVEARTLLHSGEFQQSEQALQRGLALVNHIKSIRPVTRVADHIWVAEKHLEFQPTQEVALDLIPIELTLQDLNEVISAQRLKRHLESTRAHLGRGDAEEARTELQRLRESLVQTEIELPLSSTERHMTSALSLLKEGKPESADHALQNAEAGVRFISLGGSAPLIRARKALWQAMENYSAGHHDAVDADLSKALKWLEVAESQNDPKTNQEIRRLRIGINDLLELETRISADKQTTLSRFWHKTMGLVESEAEHLYHAWRDQQSENEFYKQIIYAKLHLFYAGHELFESGDSAAAKREFEDSSEYLQSAETIASEARRAEIVSLEKNVAKLTLSVSHPDEGAQALYENTLARLRRLLDEIR